MSQDQNTPAANPQCRSLPPCAARLDEGNIPFERRVETLVQHLISGPTGAVGEAARPA
ncbi:MAG: hypothetical protein AAGE03_09370 [Pseudomonadota bacterium]